MHEFWIFGVHTYMNIRVPCVWAKKKPWAIWYMTMFTAIIFYSLGKFQLHLCIQMHTTCTMVYYPGKLRTLHVSGTAKIVFHHVHQNNHGIFCIIMQPAMSDIDWRHLATSMTNMDNHGIECILLYHAYH